MVASPDPRTASDRRGTITIRPLGPADRDAHRDFADRLTAEDLRLRFGQPVIVGRSEHCARLLEPDPGVETVFGAFDAAGAIRGVARLVRLSPEVGDVALIVRSDSKRNGLGLRLMRQLVEQARSDRLLRLRGDVLSENHAMLRLVERLGFRRTAVNGSLIEIVLTLEQS